MNAVVKIDGKPSLLATMAGRYGIDQDKMLVTLKATAFRGDVSTEQLMALCLVANAYNLNPWTREIYAFPDRNNGIVPVVGVDGWSRIVNEHPQCDGVQFMEAEDGSWIECTIHRKDRKYPTTVREYLSEVRRDTGPWKSHPRRSSAPASSLASPVSMTRTRRNGSSRLHLKSPPIPAMDSAWPIRPP
jgi:phage recombination protein Bet